MHAPVRVFTKIQAAADRPAGRHPHRRRQRSRARPATSPAAPSFIAIITVSIALEVTQEHRAESAVEALKRSVCGARDGAARWRRVAKSRSRRSCRRRRRARRRRPRAGRRHRARSRRRAGQRIAADRRGLSGRQARPALAPPPSPAEAFNALFGGTVLVRGTRGDAGDSDRRRRRASAPSPPRCNRRSQPGSLERGLHALRRADHAADRLSGAVRAAGAPRLRAAGARILPVRGGARRRHDAGAAADDHDGDAVARRRAHGRAQGGGEAARRDPRPRRHERPVHRQDRHADARPRSTLAGAIDASMARDSPRVLELAAVNSGFESAPALAARQRRHRRRQRRRSRAAGATSPTCRSISSAAASRCWPSTTASGC